MASDIRRSSLAVKAEADAICALCNRGYLRIFDGPMPEDGDEPEADQVMLSEHRFSDRAFKAADNDGMAMANTISIDPKAMNDGNPVWFRAYTRDEKPVFHGKAGDSPDDDLRVSVKFIAQNSSVHVDSFAYIALKKKA